MNKYLAYLSIFFVSVILGCGQISTQKNQKVNALIGDASFISKYGKSPDAETDNTLRIKTHLEYAEGILRGKDVSHLSEALQQKRNHLLNLLRQYWIKGIFPSNFDYPGERKPCFIDRNGNICAVGYLIEQTAGRDIAEEINKRYQYAEILAMNDQNVDHWIVGSGLTKEECAIIQPFYGDMPSGGLINEYQVGISNSYKISSGIIGASNLALGIANVNQIIHGSNNNTLPVITLLTGGAQIVFGDKKLNKKGDWGDKIAFTEEYKNLSKAHIIMGSVTIVSAIWNLCVDNERKDKRTSWNISSFETKDRNSALALTFSRTF